MADYPYDCPRRHCGRRMRLLVDEQGDSSVGMDPAGLIDIKGDCTHAASYRRALETRLRHPRLRPLENHLDHIYAVQARAEYEYWEEAGRALDQLADQIEREVEG